jgi:hypothetical protein
MLHTVIMDQRVMEKSLQSKVEDDDVDPALVEAMRERVVLPKPMPYGNRKAGPGRPKGLPKTGGRKAGTPNLMTPEYRAHIARRGKPIELLCDISAGREIDDGGTKRKPTLAERTRAAETLSRKILPDLNAAQVEALISDDTAASKPMSDQEVAMRIAFMLAKGVHDMEQTVEGHALPAPNTASDADVVDDKP